MNNVLLLSLVPFSRSSRERQFSGPSGLAFYSCIEDVAMLTEILRGKAA